MSSTVDKQQEDLSAVKTAQPETAARPVDGWRAGLINNHPGIFTADTQGRPLTASASSDGCNSMPPTTSRPGRPGPDARTAPDLHSGYNLRRGRIGVTGRYAGDWQYDLVGEFGGSTPTKSLPRF